LEGENRQLKALLQYQASKYDLQMMEVENRVYEEFEKNQWSTFILHELSTKCLDLEHFVRNSQTYAQAKKHYFPGSPSSKAGRTKQTATEGKSGKRQKAKSTLFE
jgi:hypothetical protein